MNMLGVESNQNSALTDYDLTDRMCLIPKPHLSRLAFSIAKLFQRLFSSQKKINGSQEARSSFPQDVKTIDPKVLADAMRGNDQLPEEPIFSTFEDGFGYTTDAAVNRSLKWYEILRKVSIWPSPSQLLLIIEHSLVGLFLPLCGSRCELFINSRQL